MGRRKEEPERDMREGGREKGRDREGHEGGRRRERNRDGGREREIQTMLGTGVGKAVAIGTPN